LYALPYLAKLNFARAIGSIFPTLRTDAPDDDIVSIVACSLSKSGSFAARESGNRIAKPVCVISVVRGFPGHLVLHCAKKEGANEGALAFLGLRVLPRLAACD
jgi:hypothetical protein